MTIAPQPCGRGRETKGLAAQVVGGDEEDVHLSLVSSTANSPARKPAAGTIACPTSSNLDGMRSLLRWLRPTFRYWIQTEVHVFSFSVAANVLLSFYPFLIVMMWLSRMVFGEATTVTAIDAVLRDYFPDSVAQFLHSKNHQNLPQLGGLELTSVVLLLFTANGLFEPLEIGLNHVWGIAKNRSFFRNQLISLGLIFACGSLAMVSVLVAGLHTKSFAPTAEAAESAGISVIFLKLVALPL